MSVGVGGAGETDRHLDALGFGNNKATRDC